MPEPAYEEAGGSFVTVFHNPKPEQVILRITEESREKVLSLMTENSTITTQEIAHVLKLSVAVIEKIIKTLKQQKLLYRIGPDKGGHWEVYK